MPIPTIYQSESDELSRRQALANMLMQQSMEPIQTQSVNGIPTPISPLQGLAKMFQGYQGGKMQQDVLASQRQFAQSNADSMKAMVKALYAPNSESSGAPASVGTEAPTPNQSSQSVGNYQATGSGPGLGPNGQVMPPAAIPGSSPDRNPQNQNPQALAMALMADAIGKGSPGQMELAKMYNENQKPITTRFGVFAQDPNRPGFVRPVGGASPPGALNYQFDNKGNPSLGMLPGQAASAGELSAATAGGTASGQAPWSMQQMDVPVWLPGGDQINVKMNAMQANQYQKTGQLPAEVASSIPGYKSPQRSVPSGVPISAPPNVPVARPSAAPASGQPVVGRTQSQGEQVTQTRQTAAGKAVDEQFAKDYVQFVTGGSQDAAKQLAQLDDVKKQLAVPGTDLTGPIRGSTPDMIQKFTATGRNAIAMRERVEEVVQRSLRAILGAQFTENEGVRLIARAYNSSLSEAENGIRVGRLLTQLQQAYTSKQDAAKYFERNNTLQGWNGKLPSINDFDMSEGNGTSRNPAIEDLLKKYGTAR